MEHLISDPVFQIYVASALALAANLVVLAVTTVLSRVRRNEVVNPEDKRLNAEATVVFYEGNETTQRVRRAHINALENVLPFLITGFLVTLTPLPWMAAAVLFGGFVLCRLVHSVAYVKAIQPLRTGSFVLGQMSHVALLGWLGYGVFIS